MTFIDVLAAILSGLTLSCIFIVVFIVIPTILNRLYKTPNLKDFRICRRLDGAFVVMAKNKLGFWRLLYNMSELGYLDMKSYGDHVFVSKSYLKERQAEEEINKIVEIIKKGKVKRSNKLKTIKKIKV